MLPAGIPISMESTLLQQIQSLKIEKEELIRSGCQVTEDIMKQLNDALQELDVVKSLNNELSKENKMLKEDKSTHEDLAAQAKMYSTMLENMLDHASEDPICRTSPDEAVKMEKMQETTERLQQEKDVLNDMMDEFKAMWSKDSKSFQETLRTVREEGESVKQEVARLESLRNDTETAFLECYNMKEAEMIAHKKTKDENDILLNEMHHLRLDLQEVQSNLQSLREQKDAAVQAREKSNETSELLLNEVRKFRSNLQDAQSENLTLREQKANADTKLAEQESWMQTQAIDLSSALSELFENRERTARQIQDMQECSRLKQDTYEQELAEVKRQKEDDKNYYDMEKTDLSDQFKKAERELEALRCEYNYTVPALNEQLQMLRSESNLNYDGYVKFQARTVSLEESLQQSQEKCERESEIFAATMDKVESQLNESKAALALKTMDYEHVIVMLETSKAKINNVQEEMSSLNNDFLILQDKLTSTEVEKAQLREQLAATLRETVVERERMEQKHEGSIAAVQKRFMIQLEEVKHNNMLAINQEMIKSQMALDSEKKKYTLEYNVLLKKLDQALVAHDDVKQEATNKIATLHQEVITLRNQNMSIQSKCTSLMESQASDQAVIAKLKADIQLLEKTTTEATENHEYEINRLMEEQQKRMENMGVEELDDEDEFEPTEVKVHNDSAEWEMVDEK